MSTVLRTHTARGPDDIRAFFDGVAPGYGECHGAAERLLARRLRLIRRLVGPHAGGVLLDIGCGPGVHLFALAPAFRRAIGVDLSPRMIAAAARAGSARADAGHVALEVANAEHLACIAPRSVDIAICIGALEHMPDKPAVLGAIERVLQPGGRFVCLTVNGDHLWQQLAPRLGYDVAHLSTDRFLGAGELRALVRCAGLEPSRIGYWHFVARGDMPRWAAHALEVFDVVGRVLAPRRLRGGLYACALKPL